MTQVLIIEDEPRAASQLQNLLKDCGFAFTVLDIIDSVEEAVGWFKTHPAPNLVFVDIQLADGLSFEIFQKSRVEAPIIFTTAFDQYAIQAFQVNSIDYLLKPIQQADLKRALDKFERSTSSQGISPEVIAQLLQNMQQTPRRSGILVKEGSGLVQLKITDLLYIYSEDSISFGVTAQKRYIIDETLDQFFQSLEPVDFFRINRGQIVAKKAIIKIESYFNHRLKITVHNSRDQEFIVSRAKTGEFKAWLNQ